MKKMLALVLVLGIVLALVSGCGAKKEETKSALPDVALFLAIWLWIASAVFCGLLAREKNLNIGLWVVLGILFGIASLVAITGFSKKEPVS